MSNYLNVNIPTFFCLLDTAFLHDGDPKPTNDTIVVEAFNFTSIPQRCGMFTVMSEWGTQHARVPIHYLRSEEGDAPWTDFPLDWLQLWDSISYYVSAQIVDYLKNRAVRVMLKDRTLHDAKYLFTLDWCLGPQYASGYGEMAAGHKSGHVLRGSGGQYFIQPNNRLLWSDGGSFITRPFERRDWRVFSQEFSAEHSGRRWVTESDDEVLFYEFKERHGS